MRKHIYVLKFCIKHTYTTFTHHGLFELIWFYTANEERLTHTQSPHQHLQGTFELTAESGRALPRLYTLRTNKHKHTHEYFRCYKFITPLKI